MTWLVPLGAITMSVLEQWGIGVVVALQGFSPALDGLMRGLSSLGQEDFLVLFTAFMYWCVNPSWGMRMLAVLLLSTALNGVLKWLLHAPRPYWVAPEVRALSTETSFGIPSGHAQVGASYWGMLAAMVRRPWFWITGTALVLAISLSRVYLGVHFPHDVVAGWMIGVAVLAAVLWAEPRVRGWLAPRGLAVQVLVAVLAALLIAGLGLVAHQSTASTRDLSAWAAQAASAAEAAGWTDHAIDPHDLAGLAGIWGAALGVGVGFVLARRWSRFDAAGPWSQRIVRYGIGLLGLFAIRIGLAAVFPRDPETVALLFRYLRYAMMGLWAVWLAPMAFLRLGLARSGDGIQARHATLGR
jgi:membrane-associated phospholipid phosphatase